MPAENPITCAVIHHRRAVHVGRQRRPAGRCACAPSCTSLKLASTQTPSSGTIAISGVPGDDALADLHRAFRHVARHRCGQRVARVVEIGVADLRRRRPVRSGGSRSSVFAGERAIRRELLRARRRGRPARFAPHRVRAKCLPATTAPVCATVMRRLQVVLMRASEVGLAHCATLRRVLVVVDEEAAHLAHRLREMSPRPARARTRASAGSSVDERCRRRLHRLRVVGVARRSPCRVTCGVICTTLPFT